MDFKVLFFKFFIFFYQFGSNLVFKIILKNYQCDARSGKDVRNLNKDGYNTLD